MSESADRRVLGAFRCVDSTTGSGITSPLAASSAQLVLKPNRSNTYVIFNGPGFSALTTRFLPSAAEWPDSASFEIAIRDPNEKYLPRRAQVQAPQKLAPASDAASVLHAQTVTLYPNSSAPLSPNWAVVRAAVQASGANPPRGLPWAVLRVTRTDNNRVLATGMTDVRGEALLAVPGIGVQIGGNGGGVLRSTVDVSVDAWFDRTVLIQPADWIPNPDDILNNLANATLKHATQVAQLSAGKTVIMTFSIAV